MISSTQLVSGQEVDITEIYGDEDLLSLAAGFEQPLRLAPAVATVITAKEIEAMGVRTLAEALERVPGLHVTNVRGVTDVFEIRGFFTTFNVRVLRMINGIPVNHVVYGGPQVGWSLPVHIIERIEIVRGPGSALFGADAFAGVINVITKRADDIKGHEMGVFADSFDTFGMWSLQSFANESVDGMFSIVASTTDGHKELVIADDQTRLDTLFGTSVSLAPGPVNTQRDDLDLRFDIGQDDLWRLHVGYQLIADMGTGVGTALTLDPEGSLNTEMLNADLTYKPWQSERWDAEITLSFLYTEATVEAVLLPAGTIGNAFPNGIRNKGINRMEQYRLDTKMRYKGFDDHRLLVGVGASYAKHDTLADLRNYDVVAGGLILPVDDFLPVEVFGDEPVLPDVDRTAVYALIEDEWLLWPDGTLTSGVRIDHFSDFGTTINPRLALVWNQSPSTTVKFLYGRSFRSPTFIDLYSTSDIVSLGDRDNQPETLNMLELAVLKEWNLHFFTNLNLFWYEIDDVLINLPIDTALPTRPFIYKNVAGYRGYGLEFETQYRLSPATTLYFNYALQQPYGELPDSATIAPTHQFYTELNSKLSDNWHYNINVTWLPDQSDYLLSNATLHYKKEHWRFSVSARNLLDKDLREPTLFPEALPDGVPLPGRNVRAEFSLHF